MHTFAVRALAGPYGSYDNTPYEDAGVNDNYIFLIELQQPPKDKALDFLDNENAAKPERTARVIIYNGGKGSPDVREYLVSPAAKPTQYNQTKGPGQTYPIPFDMRPSEGKEYDVIERFVSTAAKLAHGLMKDSYDV